MCSQVLEKTVSKEVHQSSCETFAEGLHIHVLEELDRITKRMQSWSKVLPIEPVYFFKGRYFPLHILSRVQKENVCLHVYVHICIYVMYRYR